MPITTNNRSILRKYLIGAASLLLAASIGMSTAFAKESGGKKEGTADSKASAESPEWTKYETELERQIVGKWFPPAGQEVYKPVTVELRIRKDGRLSKSDILKSSQIPDVDAAALNAVKDAAPYSPFPEGVKKEDFAKFEINFDKSDIDFKRKVVRKI